ncbi:N-acetylgalactosamine-6-sulfatase [Acrocarpospora corrugata]|uniref:N-acetylgalactosamine-6-sulfatase n=1 Tax=Acrocarpospora corrugata TaxID=35763 RepID=A0A5M3VZA0_9ACTN|nr:sulfatase-like hydrolase/transferase [Acrocarpospora corrugata]GES00413.1 N-acetylgalactosamine-6-sulfatase [Acrocarpospora corrugata]
MLPTTRRGFLAGTGGVLAAGLASASSAGTAAARARTPLNFVIVLADDMGWGEIGCYGQRKIVTPHLDRLAAEGVRFTSAYAGSSLCAPSRCALLTGLHTGHGTVRENPEGGPQRSLGAADLTFAELVRLAGYRTALLGKWGFGPEAPGQDSHPNVRGYDEFFGYITHSHAHQYWPSYLWHNGDKVAVDGRTYAPDLLRDRAVSFIKEAAGQPFLLHFATNLPHSPSEIPGDSGRYAHEPWTRPNRRHAAQVTRLDSHVGDIVQALRDAGVADSTVLLFTADNGPHHEKGVDPAIFDSNGPFRGVKRQLYDGGIRVPMIAWSPSLAAKVVHEPVALWDVLPTLADFARIPVPANLDGKSFRPLLTGSRYSGHEFLLWNRPRKMQAIRRGHWKLLRFAPHIAGAGPEGRIELYDLRGDRGERHNVAANHPQLVTELTELLDRSIGPDPRVPYGLRVREEAGELAATLVNGSATPWRKVRLSLPGGLSEGSGAQADELAPGESLTATFPLTARDDFAQAKFTANGRAVMFRARVPG